MTMNAANMEPLATPKDVGAAPPAGGASAEPAVGDDVAEPPVVVAGLLVMAPLEKLALGPTALLLNMLGVPVMEIKLLATLPIASVVVDAPLDAPLVAALFIALLDAAEEGFCGKVT
jgi:hypothetical protein